MHSSIKFKKKDYKETWDVQGNKNHYVPQGLAYSNMYDILLQTSYNSNHKVSMLYVTDYNTGKLIKKLKLKEQDKSDNLHHVGGIATDNSTVWITSDYQVSEYSLDNILNTKEDYIQSETTQELKIRGDFCTYHDNTLWIGDFCLKPFYPVPDDNPLLLAYQKSNIQYDHPDMIISIPKMVQGLTFNDKNEFVFTTSFTNLISSKLLIYENVLIKDSNKTYSFSDQETPYYTLSKKNQIKQIKMPPMAEGLFYKNNSYYILFENSSDTYFYAFPKMKKIIQYKIES